MDYCMTLKMSLLNAWDKQLILFKIIYDICTLANRLGYNYSFITLYKESYV